jgi:hypothetical protein
MAGCAIPPSCAGHAPAGLSATPKLTFQADHPVGADQASATVDGRALPSLLVHQVRQAFHCGTLLVGLFQPHSPSAALVGGQSTDDFTLLLALSATTADPGEACIVAGRTTGSKASGWCCPLQRRDCTAESSLKSEGRNESVDSPVSNMMEAATSSAPATIATRRRGHWAGKRSTPSSVISMTSTPNW